MALVNSEVRKFMSEIGRRGGLKTGTAKVRGNSEYYKALSQKAAKAREARKSSEVAK